MSQTATPSLQLEVITQAKMSVTNLVDYGVPFADLISGEATPPPQGARIDIHFEGTTTGQLSGTIAGVDYFNVRADGRMELNVFAELNTDDGARISFEAHGVAQMQANGLAILRQAVKLTTGHEAYAWVNGLTFIEDGTVDPIEGSVNLKIFK